MSRAGGHPCVTSEAKGARCSSGGSEASSKANSRSAETLTYVLDALRAVDAKLVKAHTENPPETMFEKPA
jgi:hypothetical protein